MLYVAYPFTYTHSLMTIFYIIQVMMNTTSMNTWWNIFR